MRKVAFFSIFILLTVSCVPKVDNPSPGATEAVIFPDYKEVTITENIAPLNFSFKDDKTRGVAVFENSGERLVLRSRKGEFHIPKSKWNNLKAAGPVIKVTLASYEGGKLMPHIPFSIFVSKESIDSFVAYRLIDPGYETWNKLGLYQRCLENFTETPFMKMK